MLRGLDPMTRRATNPALDCTGRQVRWEGPILSCEDGMLARTALPDRPIADADVVVAPVATDQALVWIITTRFASGDALGVVALAETTARQQRILALGPLRAYPARVRLRLETLGDRKVLVAEGDSCAGIDPSSCTRAVRLVPLQGDRFVPLPLVGDDRRCVAPAWFDVLRHETRQEGDRMAQVDLAATLAFDGPKLVVDEQVVIHERESSPGAPARVLRRAQAQRTVRWVGDSLVVSAPPLLGQMVDPGGAAAR
jgi:hypothetical protein